MQTSPYHPPPTFLASLRIVMKGKKKTKFFTVNVLSQKSIDEESKLLKAFETIGLRSKEKKMY